MKYGSANIIPLDFGPYLRALLPSEFDRTWNTVVASARPPVASTRRTTAVARVHRNSGSHFGGTAGSEAAATSAASGACGAGVESARQASHSCSI